VKDKVFKIKRWIISMTIILTGVISALWIIGINEYGSYGDIPAHYSISYELLNSIYYPLIFSILLIISLNFLNNKDKYSDYSKAILFIGKYSFGIYLIHPMYMVVITTLIFPHFNTYFNHLIFYPILFILTLILSYFSVYLISYSSYSEIIIGIKN
jgi:hypothetical protein